MPANLKNKLFIKPVFFILFIAATAQIITLSLLLAFFANTFWILFIPLSTLAIIPLINNRYNKTFVYLTNLLENQSEEALKEASGSIDEFGLLAKSACKILQVKNHFKNKQSSEKTDSPTDESISFSSNDQLHNTESLNRLAGGIAHDFNNIFGAISGYAEIIIDRYTDDEKLQKYGKTILSATARGSGITKKMLQFARKGKLNLTYFDANSQLSALIETFSKSFDKQILISSNLDAKDSSLYADLDQFNNVITNLADNAKEAMPEGGTLIFKTDNITITDNIGKHHQSTIIPGYYLSISVTDSGSGIDQNELSHIFEPFFTTKDSTKNSGLTLSSTYGIIKSHNGYIDAISTPGKGTTFTIYFPVIDKQCPDDKSPVLCEPRQKNILLIDDEQIIQDAVGEMLNWLGFSATIASDGSKAIEIFKKCPSKFDLIILDMIMPGMNGKECFVELQKIKPDIKVLVCSGYSNDIDRQQLFNDGVAGILLKPFESTTLTKAIYDILK